MDFFFIIMDLSLPGLLTLALHTLAHVTSRSPFHCPLNGNVVDCKTNQFLDHQARSSGPGTVTLPGNRTWGTERQKATLSLSNTRQNRTHEWEGGSSNHQRSSSTWLCWDYSMLKFLLKWKKF